MPFNTGNPVPSTDGRDLSDNAETIDKFVDGSTETVVTRTGKSVLTRRGLEVQYIFTAINNGVWAAGQVFTAVNQFMVFTGTAYKPKNSTTLPYVVGATPVGDANVEVVGNLSTSQGDARYIKPVTLAEAVADLSAQDGNLVRISDRANALFEYKTGQTPNTFSIIAADASGLDLVLPISDMNGVLLAGRFGLSPTNSDIDNRAVINHMSGIANEQDTIYFDFAPETQINLAPIIFTEHLNVNGDFPDLICLTGTQFLFSKGGIGRSSVDGVNLRGDTDLAQRINHFPKGNPSENLNFNIFSEHEWDAGVELDTATGFTNTYTVNTDPTTVIAGLHARSGRFTVGSKVKIEGFESGVFLEGVSISKIDNNALIQFCQAAIQTIADRDLPALKCTLHESSKPTYQFCFVGAYQSELQDSEYLGTYMTRCCISTVSRNTTNIKHDRGYFELNHNTVDIDGSFQKNEVYTDCRFTLTHATAAFVKLLGGSSGDNENQDIIFVRPDITFLNNVQLSVAGTPGRLSRLIFDSRYPYLPESATWLNILNEKNQALMLDPKFTRGLFNITAGSSVTLVWVTDTGNPNAGGYLEITGNGLGADLNGVSVVITQALIAPTNAGLVTKIGYEFQYDDLSSGDTIADPFGLFAGARRTPVVNLTATPNPTPDGEWQKAEFGYRTSSGFSSSPFSGGFTGILRIRNFYASVGGGEAKNYEPTPHHQTSLGVPTNGTWIIGDEVTFRDVVGETNRGAACTVAGTPGTWRQFGAYV